MSLVWPEWLHCDGHYREGHREAVSGKRECLHALLQEDHYEKTSRGYVVCMCSAQGPALKLSHTHQWPFFTTCESKANFIAFSAWQVFILDSVCAYVVQIHLNTETWLYKRLFLCIFLTAIGNAAYKVPPHLVEMVQEENARLQQRRWFYIHW